MNQVFGWLLYFVALVAVVSIGWNEPLRNRFLPPPPVEPSPVLQPTPAWKPAGTSLNRAPYDTRGGNVYYTNNYDPKAVGPNGEPPRPPKAPGTPSAR